MYFSLMNVEEFDLLSIDGGFSCYKVNKYGDAFHLIHHIQVQNQNQN